MKSTTIAIITIAATSILLLTAFRPIGPATENSLTYPFAQQPLSYTFDALEPDIDRMTMEIHYTKHHAAYTKNFNLAIEENKLNEVTLIEIFNKMSSHPASVRNNGGGFYNHLLFWQVIGPDGGGAPDGELAEAIRGQFGNFDDFVTRFTDSAKGLFGSGWTWLSVSPEGKLFISNTPNQDNPLMDVAAQRGIPILGLDLWEHAYYLNYQNKRADYVTNFWHIVNWDEVGRRYAEAMKSVN